MRTLCMAVLVLCLSLAVASAGDRIADFRGHKMFIVRNGQPTATIVISAHDRDIEKQAANALRDYIQRISGAELPIVTDEQAVAGNVIAIGRNEYQRQARVWVRTRFYPEHEAITLKRTGNILVLSGNDAKGVYKGSLFAVYAFLEGLGCRWFMPGELGEVIPQMKTIGIGEVDLHEETPYVYRLPLWLGYVYKDQPQWMKDDYYDWMAKNKQIGLHISMGHNFHYMIPRSMFDEYPEYFAQVDRERVPNAQLCTSNPDVIEICANAAIRVFDRYPNAISYSMSPNDGRGWCECDRCMAQSEHLIDRLVMFFNAVAERVEKKHPDKLLPFYVYSDLTELPVDVKPHRMLLPVVANYAGTDQAHPMTADTAEARYYRGIIEGWSALSGQIGIREYFGDYSHCQFPKPIVHVLRKNIPYWTANKAMCLSAEGGESWGSNGLPWYIAGRLIWNPELDVDWLLNDYFTKIYAEAAGPMRKYFDTLERAMVRTKGRISLGTYRLPAVYTPVLSQLEKHINRAQALARQDIVKRRVDLMAQNFEFVRNYLAMRNTHTAFLLAPNESNYEAAKSAMQRHVDFATSLGDSYVINRAAFEAAGMQETEAMTTVRDELKADMETQAFVCGLPEFWKFATDKKDVGQEQGWYRTDFDASKWGRISTMGFWEGQLGAYDGLAWYRVRAQVPDLPEGKGVFLRFGAIDESEWVYVNGQLVGSYTFDLDANPSSWKEPITFEITDAVRPGEENLFVVRVEDVSGFGGIWKGTCIMEEK